MHENQFYCRGDSRIAPTVRSLKIDAILLLLGDRVHLPVTASNRRIVAG